MPDDEDELYYESEDEGPDGVAFQAILDEVIGPANPFENEANLEDDHMLEERNDSVPRPGHEDNKTLQALAYLVRFGLPLSKLLDDEVLGDASIRSERQIVKLRTEVLKSSIISHALSRISKPPGLHVWGKAYQVVKAEIETWALDTSKDMLQAELVRYTATMKAPQTGTEVINEASLKEMMFDVFFQQVETHALWLHSLFF